MANDKYEVSVLTIEAVTPVDREPGMQRAKVLVRASEGLEVLLDMSIEMMFELNMALLSSPVSQIGDEKPDAVNVLIPVVGWGRRKSASGNEVLQIAVTPTEALQLKFGPGALDQMLQSLQNYDAQPGKGQSRKN